MQISKYILSISIPSLIFLAGCDKVKDLQNSITSSSVPTVISKKLDFHTTENTGKFVINPQFDIALDFSEGLAPVRIGEIRTGKWGFIDKQGKIVINPQFDVANFFNGGLAAVKVGDKWGFIDKQGKIVINPQFDEANSFDGGLAAVEIGGKWGFIDKQGKIVINPQFDVANSFAEELAAVEIGGKWGFIDKQGKMVVNPQFCAVVPLITEGLINVSYGEYPYCKWGYMDKQGKIVINPQFGSSSFFTDGLAPMHLNGMWGFISR